MRRTGRWRVVLGLAVITMAASSPVIGAPASRVAAGSYHSCAITSAGALWCWGDNLLGQLGDGTTTSRSTPAAVSGLDSPAVAFAAGWRHTCAVTSSGALWCWGSNVYGQLGNGTTTDSPNPVMISAPGSGVAGVTAGLYHTCAVSAAGAAYCWGMNTDGQLGDGSTTSRSAPVPVTALGSGVAGVTAGYSHTCATTTAGSVWCWGNNDQGELGDGTTTDRYTPGAVVSLGSGVTTIASGGWHTCAVTSTGAIWCWGFNNYGQVGDGTTTNRSTPVAVSGLASGAVAVVGGNSHSCAAMGTGAVWCWGANASGQLGDGTTLTRHLPVAVQGNQGGVGLAAGWDHTCTLTPAGAIWCWGNNGSGRLGDGSTTNRSTPVPTVGFRAPAGDLTRDGRSDVVWRHATGGDLWAWPMNGTVPLSQTQFGTVADTNWRIHSLGDQTGDGMADLLWRHATSGALFLWTMNGPTVTAVHYVGAVVPDYAIVGTADYTGDGRSDILWRHQTSGDLWLWQMNGAALEAVTWVAGIAPLYAVVASGDLNGDGQADLLWRHQTGGDVWAWLMAGGTATSEVHLGVVADLGYQVAGLADFDRDGRADVLWHHATTGDVWLWRMSGTTMAGITHVATVGDTAYEVAGVGDYDGNGRADVLWHHATTGALWVWLMNGATITSATWVATVPDVGYQVVNPR